MRAGTPSCKVPPRAEPWRRDRDPTLIVGGKTCNRLWLLKNSISQNWSKKLCARKLYKRLSEFSGHFLSPQFWLFGRKLEFFNSHGRLHVLTTMMSAMAILQQLPPHSWDTPTSFCLFHALLYPPARPLAETQRLM